ncbi:hypothetical protein CAL22_08870 [Bordetella genomosp. 12]|uniref:Uncharacterized protein n=1 Tax=Bordetella genomosp. 12 TaxID=463035 RepID=A0A261VM31_9BORD|nr:hypothetical protein CAL22_08870 [Bordetella genomosp. 12]
MDTPCIYSASNDVYQIWNALSFDFGYTLTMGMYDNAVRSFLLTTKQQNYESLRKILVERYGPPTNSSQQTVQSVGGGKFRSEAASWRGKAVTIELTERAGQVDESAMMIYHNRTQATYSKGKADKASKAASQM